MVVMQLTTKHSDAALLCHRHSARAAGSARNAPLGSRGGGDARPHGAVVATSVSLTIECRLKSAPPCLLSTLSTAASCNA